MFSKTVSITSSLLIFFISAMASTDITALDGSFRFLGKGPNTGLSVSIRRQEMGRCFTSFCFCFDRTIEGGIEKKYPASTAGMAAAQRKDYSNKVDEKQFRTERKKR